MIHHIIPTPSLPSLYPKLNESDVRVNDFRLKKIYDCQRELKNENSHYQQVSKKCKSANSIAHTVATLSGVTATILSSRGLTVSLSGISLIVGAPRSSVAALSGFISTFITAGKKAQ